MTMIVVADIDWLRVAAYAIIASLLIAASGIVAADLADRRGNDVLAGALIGMLFGPLGWIVIVMVGRRER